MKALSNSTGNVYAQFCKFHGIALRDIGRPKGMKNQGERDGRGREGRRRKEERGKRIGVGRGWGNDGGRRRRGIQHRV